MAMRIVLFGGGSGLADFLSVLPDHVEIVCLCDNDPNKHGKIASGHRIVSPDALETSAYDFVVIHSCGTIRALDKARLYAPRTERPWHEGGRSAIARRAIGEVEGSLSLRWSKGTDVSDQRERTR